MKRLWSLLVMLGLAALASCGGAPGRGAAATAAPARLPSVTPMLPTSSPLPTRVITLREPPVTPSPTAPPTATPGVLATENGPVTPSMAALGLAAEPYAAIGDPAAPITVVAFADFGCEFCRRHHLLTFRALLAEYVEAGKVYYVAKDLPVTSMHGALAAQAAECGGALGRYWELYNALYAEPAAWYGDKAAALARIRAAAEEAGLDGRAVEACVTSEEQLTNVDRNFAEAQALGIYGTPTFLINRKLLAGAHPPETWRELLDAELAALGAR